MKKIWKAISQTYKKIAAILKDMSALWSKINSIEDDKEHKIALLNNQRIILFLLVLILVILVVG